MTTLYHPTIPDVTHEVDGDEAAWVEQGWLKSEPTNKAVTDARKATVKAQKANAKAFATAEQVTPGVTELPAVDPHVHTAASDAATPAE